MNAARQIDGHAVSYTEATLATLNAGCDLAVVCNQSIGGGVVLDELIEGLTQAQADGCWLPQPASESRRLALLPQSAPLDWDTLMLTPAYRQALALLP
jgi:beta-N-acetylhexosaminidase